MKQIATVLIAFLLAFLLGALLGAWLIRANHEAQRVPRIGMTGVAQEQTI